MQSIMQMSAANCRNDMTAAARIALVLLLESSAFLRKLGGDLGPARPLVHRRLASCQRCCPLVSVWRNGLACITARRPQL